MSHLPVLPILIAAFGGFALTACAAADLAWQRRVSLALAVAETAVAVWTLLAVADGTPMVYALGDWPAPFGIVLVLDRLSALMVTLTAVLALCVLLSALRGWDGHGRLFHALFHFQLMGLFGAFLTGDLFNLFVFFEILLIASYGLLLHGHGARRSRAALKYVVINLAGSALFLVAVGTLYGITGTLNMADVAVKLDGVAAADMPWLRASAFLFLVVFGTKAALLPLFFWLPDAYSAASPPVAALFAIMTKVGVYAILRVYTLSFGGPDAAPAAAVDGWLLAAALLTLFAGMAGALQARSLGRLTAYLGIASVGTMMTAVASFTPAALAGGLYYLVHSTLASALLFLVAGRVARTRGTDADALEAGQGLGAGLGLVFLFAAVTAAGMPPLSGFLGKALILQGVLGHAAQVLIWTVILVTSLMAVVALSRAASQLFWKSEGRGEADAAQPVTGGAGIAGLTALLIATAALAGPIESYMRATAADLLQPAAYVDAVLGDRPAANTEGGHDG